MVENNGQYEWQPVSYDELCYKGEIARIWIQISSYDIVQAWQIGQIEKNLQGRDDFMVLRHNYPDWQGIMYWECEVLKNPESNPGGVTIALIVAAIVAAAYVFAPFVHAMAYEKRVDTIIKGKEAGVTESIFADIGTSAIKIAAAILIATLGISWIKGK